MNLQNFITSEGTILTTFLKNNKKFYCKLDPLNHTYWKELKKKKKLKNFQFRFLKK